MAHAGIVQHVHHGFQLSTWFSMETWRWAGLESFRVEIWDFRVARLCLDGQVVLWRTRRHVR